MNKKFDPLPLVFRRSNSKFFGRDGSGSESDRNDNVTAFDFVTIGKGALPQILTDSSRVSEPLSE